MVFQALPSEGHPLLTRAAAGYLRNAGAALAGIDSFQFRGNRAAE